MVIISAACTWMAVLDFRLWCVFPRLAENLTNLSGTKSTALSVLF